MTDRPADTKPPRATADRKTREARWEELIEAAAVIFYEKGYDAASLQDIADRVGILKGSIYYYIQTKSDLRNHLLLEVHNDGLAMIRRLSETPGTALEKLEAMIRGHVDYVCRNLAKTTVYLQELKKLEVYERRKLLGDHDYRDVFREVVIAGQAEGLIDPELDAKLTAQAMLGSVNSLYLWYRPLRGRPPGVIATHMVKVVLRGIASIKGLGALSR